MCTLRYTHSRACSTAHAAHTSSTAHVHSQAHSNVQSCRTMGCALTYAHARSPQLHSNTKVCSCTLLGAHLSVLVYTLRRTLAPCAHPPHSRVSMGNGGEPPLVSVHPFVFVITKSVILFIRSLPPLFHLSNQVSPNSHLPGSLGWTVILIDQIIRRRN